MAKAIPKWVQERLSKIWREYSDKKKGITYDMIEKVLSYDDKNTINAFLNELKKAEWMEVKPNEEDLRKKIYIFKTPNEVMMEIKKNGN